MPAISLKSESEWHAVRDMNVGGSEVSALFYAWQTPDGEVLNFHMWEEPPEGSICLGCCSPYSTGYRLWTEKAGLLMPEDMGGSERVDAGKFMEPAIAEWSRKRWGWNLRKVHRYMTHDTVQGWGASRDFEMVEKGANHPPVEVKNVDGMIARDQWTIEDDEVISPALHIHLQLQSQIGVGESDHGWIVVCVGGNKLARGRIPRHEPTQERITAAITAFWESVVAGKRPDHLADAETAAELFKFGAKGGAPKDLTDDPEFALYCRRLRRWNRHKKFVEGAVDRIKGSLQAKIGMAPRAIAKGFNVSWPVIELGERIVPEKIMAPITYRGGLTVTPWKPKKEPKP